MFNIVSVAMLLNQQERPPILSVVWNPLLIEINLSQIRILDIKREKVCAVCPYSTFYFLSTEDICINTSHRILEFDEGRTFWLFSYAIDFRSVLKSRGTRVHAVSLLFFSRGNDVPLLFRRNIDETSRNGFKDYTDNNGENVPEELKQVFTCVDSLPSRFVFYDVLNSTGLLASLSTGSMKSRQILHRGSNFGLRFFYVPYLRHETHGFTSLPKEVILRIFTLWKNLSTTTGIEPANLGSSGEYDNHGTTGFDTLFLFQRRLLKGL